MHPDPEVHHTTPEEQERIERAVSAILTSAVTFERSSTLRTAALLGATAVACCLGEKHREDPNWRKRWVKTFSDYLKAFADAPIEELQAMLNVGAIEAVEDLKAVITSVLDGTLDAAAAPKGERN